VYHAVRGAWLEALPFAFTMKKTHIAFIAVIVLAAIGYFLWQRQGGDSVAIDLLTVFDTVPAENKRSNAGPLAYKKGPETVGGVTRPAIYMHPTSRLIFEKQLVPDNARLRAWIAVKEEAWTQDGSDGVLFRFGVGDGREYSELLNQHVDPRHNANDRGWLPVDIDLTAYAGQEVSLIFNTNTSLPRQGDNGAFDFAVWGEPAVVERP
jgi:hypothetical protein